MIKELQNTEEKQRSQQKTSDHFDVRSLTYLEQLILRKLLSTTNALNGWEIYKKIVGAMRIADNFEDERLRMREYNKAATGKYGQGIVSIEVYIPNDKKVIAKAVSDLKKKGRNVPNYAKVIRILNDMVAAGWVKERTEGVGKAKAVFFLDEMMRKKMSDFESSELRIKHPP